MFLYGYPACTYASLLEPCLLPYFHPALLWLPERKDVRPVLLCCFCSNIVCAINTAQKVLRGPHQKEPSVSTYLPDVTCMLQSKYTSSSETQFRVLLHHCRLATSTHLLLLLTLSVLHDANMLIASLNFVSCNLLAMQRRCTNQATDIYCSVITP